MVFPIFALCAQGCDEDRRSAQAQRQPSDSARGNRSDSGVAPTLSAQLATETLGSASRTALPPLLLAKRSGASAHVDSLREKPWAKTCKIHEPCAPARPLARCSPDLAPIDAGAIGAAAPVSVGEALAVRGALALTFGITHGRACRYQRDDVQVCCEVVRASALVVSGVALPSEPRRRGIELERLGCTGDESRVCCDVPAHGQNVVAAGRLAKSGLPSPFGIRWSLTEVTLCEEEPRP